MPKKINQCPVMQYVSDIAAAQRKMAEAENRLRDAISDGLSQASQDFLDTLKIGLAVKATPKRNGKARTEKDSAIPAASFQPLNENEPTISSN